MEKDKDLKIIINELATNKDIKDIVIEDLHDNVYTYSAQVKIENGLAKIILPFSVKDHEWREDIAEELYKA